MLLDHTGRPITTTATATRPHEGATTGRLGTWGLSSSGPTAALTGSIPALRSRARDLYRNNPLVSGGVDSLISNLVGTDISPQWQLDNQEQRRELQQLWRDSCPELDYYGYADFYGLEDTVARAMVIDGEALARLVSLPPSSTNAVPLQVQLIEADHLDLANNGFADNGNEVRFGIEWSGGRPVAYHLLNEHPGESFLTAGDAATTTRVPATDICHVYRPMRPGQARGGSWLASIIVKLHEIDQYDDAEVVRKKVAALWGGFIYSDAPMLPGDVGGQQTGAQTAAVTEITLEAGTFPVLGPGQRVDFSQTADVGANYKDFLRIQFLMIARGLNITYEQLTGDLAGVTYSSIRAGLIEFRRLVEQIQQRTLVYQFCRPIIDRWIRTAVLAGRLTTISADDYLADPRRYHRVSWHPDGWDYVDPVKDRLAEQLDVRNGFDSRTAVIARRGGDRAEVDRLQAAERADAAALGLVHDSDPAQTSKAGTAQKTEDATISAALKE